MARCCSKAFAFAVVILVAGMHFPIPAFAEITQDEFRAMQRAAREEWDKLPPAERWCLDQSLRQQSDSDSVAHKILEGILPDDERLSPLRANCRKK
jgi:hypothetical protein